MRTLLVLLLLPSLAWAVPVINGVSGVVSNGNTLTITGTGFGTKSTAAPVFLDRVDNIGAYSGVSNNAQIPTGASYPYEYNSLLAFVDDPGFQGYVRMASTEGRASSKGYKGVNSRYATLENERTMWAKTNYVYASWWFKPAVQIPDGNYSTKFIRIADTGGPINYHTFVWTQMNDSMYNHPDFCGAGAGTGYSGWQGNGGAWNFMEVWIDSATQRYWIAQNGQIIQDAFDWHYCESMQFDDLWMIGWDGGGVAPPSITTWFDDIYVDNSFARVMLCNASTYSSRTACEMLSPTSWSGTGTSIQVQAYTGEFTSGSTQYVYVVDSSGSVNPSGYAVTIDSESAPILAPPTNFNVTVQ